MHADDTTNEGGEELATRESNGIAVQLIWNRTTDTVVVNVVDGTAAFVLDVGDASPMDVFHHPFAYAAFRNVVVAEEELSAVGA